MLLIEVPIVLSDAFEPEGETSDLADPANHASSSLSHGDRREGHQRGSLRSSAGVMDGPDQDARPR
jgi:hypothetical protein